MTRVLLVDDHAAFREPLGFILDCEPDIDVVAQTGSLAEARGITDGVDVAVVDLGLPDGDGAVLVRHLRLTNPSCAILVLTASSRPKDRALVVEAGAAGVLHKSASIAEIVEAIRLLGGGKSLVPPAEVNDLLRQAGRHREENRRMDAAFKALTPRERQVLQALADGLSDREIGSRLGVTTETVRSHMVHILGKLEAESRLEALVLAVRHEVVSIKRH